jgi:hypothetical protein
MRRLSMSLLAGLAMVTATSTASAQSWGRGGYPEAGACFYEDINFGGRYFCTRVGEGSERVPSPLNDEISSIRIIGPAEVIVFRDGSMRGEARRFTSAVRDMRNSGFNDRLTSYVVQPRGYGNQRGYGYEGYGAPGYGNDGYSPGRSGAYDNGRYGNGRYDPYTSGRDARGQYDYGNSRYTYQQAAVMVQQAYRRVFGREPDRAAQPWVEEVLKNNWSQRQLERALRDTPEGRSR